MQKYIYILCWKLQTWTYKDPQHWQIHDNRVFTTKSILNFFFVLSIWHTDLIKKAKLRSAEVVWFEWKSEDEHQNSFKQQNVTVGLMTWHYACHCDFLVRIMTLALHSGRFCHESTQRPHKNYKNTHQRNQWKAALWEGKKREKTYCFLIWFQKSATDLDCIKVYDSCLLKC